MDKQSILLHLTARQINTFSRRDFYFSTLEEAKKANPAFVDWVLVGIKREKSS